MATIENKTKHKINIGKDVKKLKSLRAIDGNVKW